MSEVRTLQAPVCIRSPWQPILLPGSCCNVCCATQDANAKMARPRTNPSGNSVVPVLVYENLIVREALG